MLIRESFDRRYEVTLGECWRSPEEAKRLAGTGQGISRSLHCDRLAVDLNLFRAGQFLTKTEDYREMGEWWEKQHPDCRWGGRFTTRPDGNHFSVTYQGRS
ncbi:MAG: M15 family peptidase [Proteobacteria bacterium]|nr:M15 family peptidase [Verrucomicrobiota bacterium]NBU11517.1 M15 family peptidase [Pseudomonadota bacterium]NDF00178.1 M15 family peptidase [Verrucomicrobiota bacterium]